MMRKLLFILFAIGILGLSVMSSPQAAYAQSSGSTGCEDKPNFFLGFPTWYQYLELSENCEIAGPMRADDPTKIDWQRASGRVGLAIVEILLRVAALLAVAHVMYGGFRYITSQGDPENAKSARQTILNGLIGLVICMLATGAVAFTGSLLS